MKKLLFAALVLMLSSCSSTDHYTFKPLFNGENWEGWYLKIRSNDSLMAERVYAIEDGQIHVFNDQFPAEFELEGENNTHGLFYTDKSYSRYILRFEYKWGSRIANNFSQYQYDAGLYYHVTNDRIWPTGVEYQIRYNHLTDTNHTGDYWGTGVKFDWTFDADRRYLPLSEGAQTDRRKGEHLGKLTRNFHALDGEWNQCEVIVMGDRYSIHKLNGEVVNVATNLEVGAGKIGFQSETAEIFYRNIEICELEEELPIEKFLR